MNMLLGLDYELFFGAHTGTVEHCMLKPTQALATALSSVQSRHAPRLTLFVDACFLLRLKQLEPQHPELAEQRRSIETQLKDLSRRGHSIQLHIHTHWLDCNYHNGQWQMDTHRYRLHDINPAEQITVLLEAVQLLSEISEQPVFAFRAGGWCLQPFDQIADALHRAGIWLDSTVYPGGVCEDPVRWFDFRNAPNKSHWTFDQNPLESDEYGRFVEVPISHQRISPAFFWRMAIMKKLAGKGSRAFGDGHAMVAHSAYYWDRLTKASTGPASIDGIKGDLLESAYQQQKTRNPNGFFNVMGHPKALTPRSIKCLTRFLEQHQEEVQLISFEELSHLKPERATRGIRRTTTRTTDTTGLQNPALDHAAAFRQGVPRSA